MKLIKLRFTMWDVLINGDDKPSVFSGASMLVRQSELPSYLRLRDPITQDERLSGQWDLES